jgi:chromosome segregation ATPase
MFTLLQRASLATTFGLLALAGVCRGQGDVAQLTREIEQLKQQNRQLQQSLLEANRSARESSEQLDQVRARLAALGRNLLDGGDDRLVRAAADLQLANERIRKIEDGSSRLMAAINGGLRPRSPHPGRNLAKRA